MKETKNKTSGDWFGNRINLEGLTPKGNKKIKKFLGDGVKKKFLFAKEGWNDSNPMNG